MGFQVFDVTTPLNYVGTFHAHEYGFPNNFLSANPVPARLDSLIVSNADTIDHTILLLVMDAPLLTAVVPAGAGSAGVDPVDLMQLVNAKYGVSGLVIAVGFTVGIEVIEDILDGGSIHFAAFGGYF